MKLKVKVALRNPEEKYYETKDTSYSHVIPFHQSQAAALALLGNPRNIIIKICMGEKNRMIL